MLTGLHIAHDGYAAGVRAWMNQATKKKRDPPTYFSFFVCVLTVLYFLLQFFVFIPDHKNTSGFVVFFSLIFPTLHPQNPFFANMR